MVIEKEAHDKRERSGHGSGVQIPLGLNRLEVAFLTLEKTTVACTISSPTRVLYRFLIQTCRFKLANVYPPYNGRHCIESRRDATL